MTDSFGKRHPVCMIHVGILMENVNEWNSKEEIIAEMEKAIEKVTYPENAKVQAWFAFLPDPTSDTKMIDVQRGFDQQI